MDTKDIRSFRLVYEERSINRAAKQLFITPQGLSRIIHKLEEELQIVLFERTKGGMVPTECGDYFYAQSQELLYQLEDIKYHLQKMNSRQRKIKIGFACGVLNLVSLKKLNAIQREMPDVSVQWEEMENQEVAEQVNRGLLDIGFIIGTIPGNEVESCVVYEGKMNVLVYPGHPFYEKERLSIEELKEQPLISLNQKYFSYHSFMQRCGDFGFVPNIVINTMESQLIYRFCNEKLGLGIDADIHKTDRLYSDIRRIELHDAIPWKVSMIYRKNETDRFLVERLAQII